MPSLNERFLKLWTSIGANGSADGPYAEIVSRYSEPWRAYHVLAHLDAMFAELDAVRSCWKAQLVVFEPLEMAIWYHDAVYNTHANDNEERSADLFRNVAERLYLSGEFKERVIKIILATKHLAATDDLESATLCDIDLSIFGQPEAVFDEYERQIRKEYGWVPKTQFNEGRLTILRAFLNRPMVFSTSFFREKYEEMARKNLLRSIEQVGKAAHH